MTARASEEAMLMLHLANELALRDTLDSLFYANRIVRRLDIIDSARLESFFPKRRGERSAGYGDQIAREIAGYFSGYSVRNVFGRYRKETLLGYHEAAALSKRTGRKYMVGETSAAIDFIIPVPAGNEGVEPRSG